MTRTRWHARPAVAWVILLGLAVTSCGGGGSASTSASAPPASDPAVSVTVTPARATVYQGSTVRFQAQVVGEADQSVNWSIEQGIGSIDATGLYTAPRDAYGGPFHVVAASASFPAANGFAIVNVAPIQLTVAPENVTLKPGGSAIFTATVLGLDDSRVTWKVQEPAGGSITDSGTYLAPYGTGFFHVVATAVADAGTSGTATVTVTTSSASFRPTGKLHTGRALHTATLLANGQVLVTGGGALADPLCIGGLNSAELYSPDTGSFSPTGSMATLRYAHTATLLPQGAVLVTGGFGSGRDCEDLGEPAQDSAELYDPSTASFKSTGRMLAGRGGHSATLLPDGRVLLTGGGNQGGGEFPFYGVGTRAAELYDPSRGVFVATGSMAMERLGHTATLLLDGTVLIAGGGPSSTSQPTNSAEVYEPGSGAFVSTGSLSAPRSGHTATLLPNGKVLIAGGYTAFLDGEFQASASAEIYDPLTRTFSATGNMGLPRYLHTATLLADGTVLVAGGGSATAEIFNPSTGVFVPTGGMDLSRSGHTSTRLKDGKVLTVGSYLSRGFAASAELYW